ncbi:MAG TPA: hypothetical protein VG742_13610 [Dongiaceae bacterium]|nr:hypothetical protein [Dongiaceae bacterium]
MIFEMMGREHMTRAKFGAALLAVTLLAGGCAQKPVEDDNVAMVTKEDQLRSAPTQPSVQPNKPVEEQKPKKTASTSKQPDPANLVPLETAPVYSAAELVGKSQSEVAALIGNPAQVEQRAASTVWTYRGESCGLDVFFFLDMATSDERVLTVESRADKADPTTATTGDAAAATTVAGTTAAPAATATAETAVAPASGQSSGDAGSVVDACYGTLRRS